MLAHGADSTWSCFARGSLRPFYVNHPPGRLKPTRLRLCMMTSFREFSMTSSRLTFSSVVHDRRIRGLTPTAGLPSASLAAWSGLFWQLLIAPPLHLAVPLLPRRLPLPIRPESHGTIRDVVTANSATRSVSHSGRTNLHPPRARATCGLLSTACWDVDAVPVLSLIHI